MKTKLQIKTMFGKLLFEFEKEDNTIKDTINEAVKQRADLRGADLQRAYLQHAYLQGAYLQHAYLRGADLRGAYLQRADLQGADLRGAYLQRADLRGADLQRAYLQRADLRGADLQRAYLQRADLRGAYLQRAYLQHAYLQGAYLQHAYLRGADLRGADLQRADLQGADLQRAYLQRANKLNTLLPEGELIVWKKLCNDLICKLLIPVKAKRVNCIGSRKCRFEYCKVIAIYDGNKRVKEGRGQHNNNFVYKVGEIVKPDKFDDSPLIECSNGIHAFITRLEAEEY